VAGESVHGQGTGEDVVSRRAAGSVKAGAVTDRWGVTVRPDGRGKTVWFECLGRRRTVPVEAEAGP
jgi:hypothetical protein